MTEPEIRLDECCKIALELAQTTDCKTAARKLLRRLRHEDMRVNVLLREDA